METDRIKQCGHHPDSGCTCRNDVEVIPDPDEDHMMAKQIAAGGCDTNSPWGPSTSQADEIRRKASDPGMYDTSRITLPARMPSDPVVWVERLAPHIFEYRIENVPEDEKIVEIMQTILPKVLELYLAKVKDYGGVSGGLGPRAPFVDMWRKMIKLKRSLWEGEELKFEQPSEVLKDMVGTVLNILVELPEHGIQ
jgi:hypothetical protein